MYASTLTALNDNLITWKLNNTLVENGVFSNSKTTLTIENVQLSDAGIYRIIATKGGVGNSISSSSNTTLHILGQLACCSPIGHWFGRLSGKHKTIG